MHPVDQETLGANNFDRAEEVTLSDAKKRAQTLHEWHIRLNTELVKKPKDLLEYVIVHEMAHLLEPYHSERFVALLDLHYPTWKEARAELNALPLASLEQIQG